MQAARADAWSLPRPARPRSCSEVTKGAVVDVEQVPCAPSNSSEPPDLWAS